MVNKRIRYQIARRVDEAKQAEAGVHGAPGETVKPVSNLGGAHLVKPPRWMGKEKKKKK